MAEPERPAPGAIPTTRVLVAGGGTAALETVLELRDRTDGAVHVTLLSPDGRHGDRPLEAYGPLVPGAPEAVDLARVAADHGVGVIGDRLAAVDPAASTVTTAHGATIAYEALVVAIGGTPRVALPGAVALGLPSDAPAFAALVERVRAGAVDRLAVVVPPGIAWTLPAYEAALLLRDAAPEGTTRIVVTTPEPAPLAAFGPELGTAVEALLRERDVALAPGTFPDLVEDGRLWMPWQGAVDVDAVVALAGTVGPAVPGLPSDRSGFLPVDRWGRVVGQQRIWAAGDAASHPVKQGGLAVQQAGAVAADVAATLGIGDREDRTEPEPPVLRAALLDGRGALYLRAEHVDGRWRGEASRDPLWWPPTKIAGGRLAAYRARLAGERRP